MNTAYLLIGGNMGNRMKALEEAINLLQQQIGKVVNRSSVYETDAWGNENQADFLNQVLIIETPLSASGCMLRIFSIENKMGRIRAEKNDPRTMDIDILFFNHEVLNEPGVTVPHPQIQHRKFVLAPLNELSPHLVHPVLHTTIADLLLTCADPLQVRLFNRL